MGFSGSRERRARGGNKTILGTAKAPMRQDAVFMITRKLLVVNVCEAVKRPSVRTTQGPNNLAWLHFVSL